MATPIVAAYEPFLEDRAPVELALLFGELTGTPVLAGAVHSAALIDGWMEPLQSDPEILAAGDRALELLRGDTGVQGRSIVDVSVPRALHELARELGSGLIVVGSTKRGRVGRVLPGSTAERVLHGAECAVALAPNGYRRRPIETMAVGFIDSPEGHAALAAAHALALRAGARLRVISAVHPSGELDAALANGTPPERAHMLQGHHRAEHQDMLDRAVAALPPGVEIEAEIHVADAADVLLRVSEHVDVLVCGSRGYGPLRSVLLGGVSRRLVEGAHCPVLVLPRGMERPLGDLLGPLAEPAAR
jgi:nucleotide-binding universal stress UspA family protein